MAISNPGHKLFATCVQTLCTKIAKIWAKATSSPLLVRKGSAPMPHRVRTSRQWAAQVQNIPCAPKKEYSRNTLFLRSQPVRTCPSVLQGVREVYEHFSSAVRIVWVCPHSLHTGSPLVPHRVPKPSAIAPLPVCMYLCDTCDLCEAPMGHQMIGCDMWGVCGEYVRSL